jgi:hypothetical protein
MGLKYGIWTRTLPEQDSWLACQYVYDHRGTYMTYVDENNDVIVHAYMPDKQDAMLFKLTWG